MLAVRVRLRPTDPPAGTDTAFSPEAGVLAGSAPNRYSSQEGAPSTSRFTEGVLPLMENRLTEVDAEFSPSSVSTVIERGLASSEKVAPVPIIWKSASAKSLVVGTLASIR